jgi:translation initiation factor 1
VSDARLVYSTDGGDHRKTAAESPPTDRPREGIVRVSCEKARRGGKTVTVVTGLPRADLSSVASDLKRLCGSGGSVKDGRIELQGDQRRKVAARLQTSGHTVEVAGG